MDTIDNLPAEHAWLNLPAATSGGKLTMHGLLMSVVRAIGPDLESQAYRQAWEFCPGSISRAQFDAALAYLRTQPR